MLLKTTDRSGSHEAMVHALARGDLTMAKTLIDRGANINHLYHGVTPLINALYQWTDDLQVILAFALAHGADPTGGNQVYTPMRFALRYHLIDLAITLHEAGISSCELLSD